MGAVVASMVTSEPAFAERLPVRLKAPARLTVGVSITVTVTAFTVALFEVVLAVMSSVIVASIA
ncbi:MAG TPA: hypothetical protein VFX03_07430, partial [Thermomicrobiales bacterium]|nr:hypothetical protein [Thermomicrobiales bacterium]